MSRGKPHALLAAEHRAAGVDADVKGLAVEVERDLHRVAHDAVGGDEGPLELSLDDPVRLEAQRTPEPAAIGMESAAGERRIADRAFDGSVGMNVERHGQLPLVRPVYEDARDTGPAANHARIDGLRTGLRGDHEAKRGV